MIVFDNVIFSLQKAGGISVYWSELISRCNANEALFFGDKSDNIFASSLDIDLEQEIYPRGVWRRYLPFWPKLESAIRKQHIFHSSYFRYSNNSCALNVTTVHDFTYEHYVQGIKKWIHGLQKKKAIEKSAGIICVSESTRQDLINFYPWIDVRRIRVIYNGVGSEFYPLKSFCSEACSELGMYVDRPFLLFVGDRSPYKNFDIFVALADLLPGFDLIVVGGKPFSDKERSKLSSISSRVKHFIGISSEKLNLLYNAAYCLVYPSSYEGFGIPLLEAMKAGCPVVSTNLSSIPEVAGDAALLVDEITVEDFVEQIRKLSNESFRKRLIQKGFSRADQFSWDKCFEETYAFYQELLKRSELE